jgi:hypothetical protein
MGEELASGIWSGGWTSPGGRDWALNSVASGPEIISIADSTQKRWAQESHLFR